mgnify:CR=1 FL=1
MEGLVYVMVVRLVLSIQNVTHSSSYRTYELKYIQLLAYEAYLDFGGWKVKREAWLRGLWRKGLQGARDAAAGLPVAESSL